MSVCREYVDILLLIANMRPILLSKSIIDFSISYRQQVYRQSLDLLARINTITKKKVIRQRWQQTHCRDMRKLWELWPIHDNKQFMSEKDYEVDFLNLKIFFKWLVRIYIINSKETWAKLVVSTWYSLHTYMGKSDGKIILILI